MFAHPLKSATELGRGARVLGCNSIIRQSSGTFSEAPEPICLPGKLQLLEPYGIFARHSRKKETRKLLRELPGNWTRR